jgi:CheY-like chemotaxis protein
MRPVALSSLLLGMRELLERTLGSRVRVNLDLDARVANVLGDQTQIELAILNLAINARDAMPEGGELAIGTGSYRAAGTAELPSGDYIELTVSDTGSGMPPEIISRAFDPFFTTKGVGKGTGLGLSQVYAMARQAGGLARIQSAPGRGTAISILLPCTDDQVEVADEDVAAATAHVNAATILIIDDDHDVRRFLADSLNSFGYAVLQAEDGPRGLEALREFSPQLAIVDYAMPGMTGAEVARAIRDKDPDFPIIFASGYAETSALESFAENSVLLRKPFRLQELQDAVRQALTPTMTA